MTKFYQTCNFFVIGILSGTLCDQPTDVYNNALCILLHFIKRVIFFVIGILPGGTLSDELTDDVYNNAY